MDRGAPKLPVIAHLPTLSRLDPPPPEDPPMPPAMPSSARPVRHGGLMRCCLQTLHESQAPSEEGTQTQCHYCHAVMEVDPAGAWVWIPMATAEAWRKVQP